MIAPSRTPPRILVVKLATLGDLLTATPALRSLRVAHPDAHIAVLAPPGGQAALAGLDSVDRVIPFNKFAFDRPMQAARGLPVAASFARMLRAERWDAVLLLHHLTTTFGVAKYAALALACGAPVRAGINNGRGWFLTRSAEDRGFGWQHEVDYWLSAAALLGGVPPARPQLEIAIQPVDQAWADDQWQRLGGGPALLLGPGSGNFSTARRWAPDAFAHLARAAHARFGLRPLVLGGLAPDEQALATRVAESASGLVVPAAPNPRALAAFIQHASALVANDSGPVHLAAAVGTPVVAIFGPTNYRAWGPYPPGDSHNQVVREQVVCSPCIHRGHRFGTPQGCPARTCLAALPPSAVLQALAMALYPSPGMEHPAAVPAA